MEDQKDFSSGGIILCMMALINAVLLEDAYTSNGDSYWWLFVSMSLLAIAIKNRYDKIIQDKNQKN